MTSTNESNNTHRYDEETDSREPSHDESVRTPPGHRGPVAIMRGPGSPGAHHCLLCQAETVGACLLCHRPLCEQCGASSDEFLRCPTHHEREVEELRSTLRWAALAVISTKRYVDDLVALRNRVLHEVSAALLRSYVEHIGGVPSPTQIQQMRRVAFAFWNSLATVTNAEEAEVLPGEDEGEPRTRKRDMSRGTEELPL